MKAMKKLIPAVAMLLVSVVTMSTASFAWFSMSRQVTAQGMNVTVSAPTNLLIKYGAGDYGAEADATAVGTKLVPASTVDAKAFFIVDTARTPDTGITSSGGALAGGAVLKNGTNTDGAYIDFVYTVKNQGDATVNVAVMSITVEETSTGKSILPVRVAVKESSASDWILFAPVSGADNQESGKAISAQDKTKGNVTYTDISSAYSGDVVELNANEEAEITIRVWYEGEDKACVNANGATEFDLTVVLADSSAPRS